jgi:hypothetical protein
MQEQPTPAEGEEFERQMEPARKVIREHREALRELARGSQGQQPPTMAELLKSMKPGAPRSEEEQAWLDMQPVGREILPEEEEAWLQSFRKETSAKIRNSRPQPSEERERVDAPPAGDELL